MTASYWPFLDLLREYFAWSAEDDEAARAGRLVAALRELVSQGDLSETRLDEMGPLLGHLFSLGFGTDWDERLKNAGPEEIKHRTFLAIRDLFLALSRRQPVILVLEDLHWADSLSLDLLSLLMEAVTLAPLFLLCVYRPEREHKCWHLGTIAARKCAERYTEISLRELSAGQSRRLIESLLSIDNLPSAVKEAILQKSGGNPFFVEEVVRSLIASGLVYQEADAWKAREGIEQVTVPESIQSVILSRVDRLEQNLKRVLQSAAAIGRLFRRRLLERVVESSGLRVERAEGRTSAGPSTLNSQLSTLLWELEEQALIYQERAVPEEEYSFKHVLTQETIYQNILRPRRAIFHQQVAEAIEVLYQEGLEEYYEQLAFHYERSGADEKAVEYLLKAGEKARLAYLSEEAILFFQRALERLERSGLDEGRQGWRLEALKGLGQVCHGVGREGEAEQYLRRAIATAGELELPAREIVRLHHWLADALHWQGRMQEVIRTAEEGLALLGGNTACVEAALMYANLAGAHFFEGDREKLRQFNDRNTQFLQQLPYTEELRLPYIMIIWQHSMYDKGEQTNHWARSLEQQAERHHDLRALAEVDRYRGAALYNRGGLHRAVSEFRRGLELYVKIGDAKHEGRCLRNMLWPFLSLGDLQKADECAHRAIELLERAGLKRDLADAYEGLGAISLCQGAREKAIAVLKTAVQLRRELRSPEEPEAVLALGRACLAHGDQQEASRRFEEAIILVKELERVAFPLVAGILAGLEEVCENTERFRAFCHRFREERPQFRASPLGQWFLESTQVHRFSQQLVHEPFVSPPSSDWIWQDPLGDCSFAAQDGLRFHAANGRDLWQVNLSAPRLLRLAESEFAAQTVCFPVSDQKPTIGGLLLWRDQQNYLRLARGTRGKHEISFQGCLENKDVIIGRGRLPSERIFLRLERRDGRVRALCSADGEEWFTVGQVEFPVADPVEVGLHAIGMIHRTIYPGAYPEGTAIRFESFSLWG